MLLLTSLTTCKKPYLPAAVAFKYNYLVVDGFINSGSDTTFIKLSRATSLNGTKYPPETGASVFIESDQNDKYSLTELDSGTYITLNLNLPTDRNYRLHIITQANKEYASDFVPNKIAPPIDSISPQIQKNGIEFLVNAHDNSGKTRYYYFDWDETWTYESYEYSNLKFVNDSVEFRTSSELLNFCYHHNVPQNAFSVTTTNKLSSDVVYQFPVGYVDATSGKLYTVYSMEVTEYALTPEGYTFWQLLKNNTTALGSVFDPVPSSTIGNIHSLTNKNEIVIGFVSVSAPARKRIFIQGDKLPFATLYPMKIDTIPGRGCNGGSILIDPSFNLPYRLNQILGKGDTLLTVVKEDATGHIIGYFYAPTVCVDCRTAGGTTIKPPYWP